MTPSDIYLKHLSLTNFRKYFRLDIELPRRLVLFVGDNAQGKTSVLESIYYLATFTSLHSQTDRQLMNYTLNKDSLNVTRMVADYSKNDELKKIEVRLIDDLVNNGSHRFRKEILLDGVKKSAQDSIGNFNAVLYIPQMTRIIEGGPDERRRYLNLALSQAIQGYAKSLTKYSKILTQRNALLKQIAENRADLNQLSYWNALFIETAAEIVSARYKATSQLNKISKSIHHSLSHGSEEFDIKYKPALHPKNYSDNQNNVINNIDIIEQITHEELFKIFERNIDLIQREEIIRGVSIIGPHRDEVRFFSNNIDLGVYGSRGQIRTALLTLKLSEKQWLSEATNCAPILLLDEVLAELDTQRRIDLFNYLKENGQVLMTTADRSLFSEEFLENCTIYQVNEGLINQLQ